MLQGLGIPAAIGYGYPNSIARVRFIRLDSTIPKTTYPCCKTRKLGPINSIRHDKDAARILRSHYYNFRFFLSDVG